MGSYRDLLAWQIAIELVDDVYAAVRLFPQSEMFALSQQMRRAAVSIPCNVAEGWGRWSRAEYRQYVRQARGSNLELQTQIIIATRQRFIERDAARLLFKKAARVGQLLNGLLRSLNGRA